MSHLLSALRGVALIGFFTSSMAVAQGFQLQQHEPTAAGDGFFAVSRPWYAEQGLAMGLTFNYGKDPLLGGDYPREDEFHYERTVISDQLAVHLGIAGALFDRVQLSLSAPLMALERGTPAFGVSPNAGMRVGDPRLGAMFRLWGADAFALHAGGDVWVPTGAAPYHAGDEGWRGALQLVADGTAWDHVGWAVNGGVLLRGFASLNGVRSGPGTTGNAAQVAAAVAWEDSAKRYQVGPELVFSTALSDRAFKTDATRLELLLGGRYHLTPSMALGPAVGMGLVRSPGTPAFRALLSFEASFGGKALLAQTPRTRVAQAESAQPQPAPTAPAEPAPEPAAVAAAEPELAEEAAPAPGPAPAPAAEEPPQEPEIAVAAVSPKEPEPEPQADHEPQPEPTVAEAPSESNVPEPSRVGTPDELAPSVRGDLRIVYFASNQDALFEQNRAFLETLAGEVQSSSGPISVEGHGDDTGPAEWNQTLSVLRAEAVRRFLVSHGVDRRRITVQGYGATKPSQSNDSAQGRAANRRVEIRVSK